MRSLVLTPPTGMLCVYVCVGVDVCVQHADTHVYPLMFLRACTCVHFCAVGCILICICVRISSSKFICISLMRMTTPPKHGKNKHQ